MNLILAAVDSVELFSSYLSSAFVGWGYNSGLQESTSRALFGSSFTLHHCETVCHKLGMKPFNLEF